MQWFKVNPITSINEYHSKRMGSVAATATIPRVIDKALADHIDRNPETTCTLALTW